MLKCSEVDQQISLLIDGELKWYQKAKLQSHLAICKNCRRFVKYFKASQTQFGKQELTDASDVEVKKIMDHLDHHAKD